MEVGSFVTLHPLVDSLCDLAKRACEETEDNDDSDQTS